MKRDTKLTEKATRIPDPHWSRRDEVVTEYLREVEPLKGESARSVRFGMLVKELLGVEPGFIESYVAGIEKYLKVKQKDRVLKGEADNLFGNVIVEFETSIAKKRSEAEGQLRRYVAIVWSQEVPETRKPYLCVATDGIRFVTYSPRVSKPTAADVAPEDVHLHVLEEADWTKLKPHEVYFWLDRHFLRKEILPPTSEMIVDDFGVHSHAFQATTGALLSLWQQVKGRSSFAVIYDSWEKYLRIVYGSQVAGDELFIRHTYLATLAKLMSWLRITDSAILPEETEVLKILEGRFFKEQGIENFIEEDFFSWLARGEAAKVGISAVRWLFSLLQNFNLHELSEDVLKSLYQELVDPETRHDLGEVYTPDWLAHRMVNKLLDTNPSGSMFDPACGSGTFLYLAIREKRKRLKDSQKTLNHILESVYGADVHPLAVIVAKTNYILALGDLLKKRKDKIAVPVYLADMIKLPESTEGGMAGVDTLVPQLPGYKVELNGCEVNLPQILLDNVAVYDEAIELAKEYARQNKGKSVELQSFGSFLAAQHFAGAANASLVRVLFATAETLKRFIDTDRDTIWAFVLKNSYKPLFLKGKFDFIMGNPPWIAFRFMEPVYQTFLKRQITHEYRLLRGRGELITHLEVATLFLARAADLYLKNDRTIAFVMPRSLFSSDQHEGLRKRTFKLSESPLQTLYWREIWDCENVTPLFNVPACVVIAGKGRLPRPSRSMPEQKEEARVIPGQVLSANLKRKNASLPEAEQELRVEGVEFSLHTRGKRSFWATGKGARAQAASFYKKRFAQGATIVPRSFWFVQVVPSPLGFNPDLAPLETADRAREQAKEAYESVHFQDTVESRFLYATLLSTDLLPFGHLDYRLVVLPIEPSGDHFGLIDADEAQKRGCLHLARWLDKAQAEWTSRRGAKAGRIDALGWLDYRRKLTAQNPLAKYRVVYPDVNRIMLASMVQANRDIPFRLGRQIVHGRSFLADYTTYCLEVDNRNEAMFLVSVLNSRVVDGCLQPFRRKGQKAHPHVVKKVFDVAPIPRFAERNDVHLRLAQLGEGCSASVVLPNCR